MKHIGPAINEKNPSEIARVGFCIRTKLPGGVGGPGAGFLAVVAIVSLPLLLSSPQTPRKTQNTPGKLVRVKNPTRAISGGRL